MKFCKYKLTCWRKVHSKATDFCVAHKCPLTNCHERKLDFSRPYCYDHICKEMNCNTLATATAHGVSYCFTHAQAKGTYCY
jgi:hypothetical protein